MTSNGHHAAAIKAEKADATWLIPPELGRRVVETADEGIWVLDDGGATVFANPKMAAILGSQPIRCRSARVNPWSKSSSRCPPMRTGRS